jgi:hypothetical protein
MWVPRTGSAAIQATMNRKAKRTGMFE